MGPKRATTAVRAKGFTPTVHLLVRDKVQHSVLSAIQHPLTVLVTLISNSSEQSGQGGAVRVRIGPRGAAAMVTVADRGPALPGARPTPLLESFSRPGQQTSNEAAALGLAVARWIVEAHGGTVGARNRRGG